MEAYIGCKVILGEEMDLDTFNSKYNRIVQPPDHISTQGYHVIYPDGYDSWSPKDVFKNAYRKVTAAEKALLKE